MIGQNAHVSVAHDELAEHLDTMVYQIELASSQNIEA